MPRTVSLEKLREREAALKQQIKEAGAVEARREEELNGERSTLIGAALVAEMKGNEDLAAQLAPVIDRHITKAKDRKLLGLTPKPRKKRGQTADSDAG